MASFIIAVETSGSPVSIAIATEKSAPRLAMIEGRRPDLARELMPALDALVRDAGHERRELARVVLGVGPGSYTGLRIGASAARALAHASGAPIAAYASTQAAAAACGAKQGRVAVALDALRGDFGCAIYELGGPFPRELRAPSLVAGKELEALIEGCVCVATDQPEQVRRFAPSARCVPAAPDAALLLLLDRAGAPQRPEPLPIYLRASAAEENAKPRP